MILCFPMFDIFWLQMTKKMQIPLLYAEAIIGIEGKRISYIRRASGAELTIRESITSSDEITVEIKGTSQEVQAAELLIQVIISQSAHHHHHNHLLSFRYMISCFMYCRNLFRATENQSLVVILMQAQEHTLRCQVLATIHLNHMVDMSRLM